MYFNSCVTKSRYSRILINTIQKEFMWNAAGFSSFSSVGHVEKKTFARVKHGISSIV